MTVARKKWTDYAAKASTQPALFEAPEQPRRRRAGTCKKPSIPEREIQRQILSGLLLHLMVARIERINVMAGRLFGKGGTSRFMRSCAKGRVDLDGFSVTGRSSPSRSSGREHATTSPRSSGHTWSR
ncbi:MAG: hypothetical protein IPK44_02575 [Candidatus Accumulibacter sp.]|uniref:hypothetical protein n=1 Tax=Accumulibacter sp. TaxID=2053492 RepID=UPI00258D3291|nr:hypothetical protein [Accumulibacter sp.]MBK8113487.1 hypothetical protein [Accumulibacter sp.]